MRELCKVYVLVCWGVGGGGAYLPLSHPCLSAIDYSSTVLHRLLVDRADCRHADASSVCPCAHFQDRADCHHADASSVCPCAHFQMEVLQQINCNSKRYAAAALAKLSTLSSAAEAIKPIVAKLKSQRDKAASPVVRTTSTDASGNDQGSTSVQTRSKAEHIAAEGAIAPLVRMLSGERGLEAQEEAAGALWALADTASIRLAITEAGGIGPLVALLGSRNNLKAREHAEAALVRLSIETSNRVLIIKQLVSMLISDPRIADARKETTDMCSRTKMQSDDANKALEEAQSAVADAEKKGLAEAKAADLAVRRAATFAEKVASEAEKWRQAANEAARKATDEETAQEQAAAALANLARESIDNVRDQRSNQGVCKLPACVLALTAMMSTVCLHRQRMSIVDAGGIPVLLELMSKENTSSSARENTIAALIQIAWKNQANQEKVATAGGIVLLVQALSKTSGSAEGASTVASLAAQAIWRLTEGNPQNKVLVAEAGGIAPLVTMLGSTTQPEMCMYAAAALAMLIDKGNDENQVAIARTGAVIEGGCTRTTALSLLHRPYCSCVQLILLTQGLACLAHHRSPHSAH